MKETTDLSDACSAANNTVFMIHQKNTGVGGARSVGMDHAEGTYALLTMMIGSIRILQNLCCINRKSRVAMW